jgi:hypothetical protein
VAYVVVLAGHRHLHLMPRRHVVVRDRPAAGAPVMHSANEAARPSRWWEIALIVAFKHSGGHGFVLCRNAYAGNLERQLTNHRPRASASA